MVRRGTLIVLVVLLVAGCYDRFYGPSIRNTADKDITISVKYADGRISRNVWPPCLEAFIGKGDQTGDVIQEIVIEMDGRVIHRLNAEQVRNLLEKEKSANGSSVWSIDQEGIHFEKSAEWSVF